MNDDIKDGAYLFKRYRERLFGIGSSIIIISIVFLTVLLNIFAFIPIDGDSMENTIRDKQYCLVQRTFFSVKKGDMVTVNTAESGEKDHTIIKRIVATAGDKLIFMQDETKNFVDLYIRKSGETKFIKLKESYIKERMSKHSNVYYDIKLLSYTKDLEELDFSNTSADARLRIIEEAVITVEENRIFVLGDNRNISKDSRFYGTFPLSKVTSKVLAVI